MKTTFLAILLAAMASTSLAGVRARIYRADEVTPLPWADPNIPDVYQDIMAGTHLTIFIESDAPESGWTGGLSLSWEDWNKGMIEGRGYNEDSRNYDASVLPASGDHTFVTGPKLDITGVLFDVDLRGGLAGEWAVLDYHAQAVGSCRMGLFGDKPAHEVPADFDPMEDAPPPADTHWLQGLTFHHVLSRDYNDDAIVNFVDFALLAGQWQGEIPDDPNATASFDLDGDEIVEAADLMLFCDYWLERTDIVDPNTEPNAPEVEP